MTGLRGVLALALFLAVTPSAWADFEAGQAAFDAGRFDEALAEWRAAADDGDGRAMLALGRVHVRGVGAPQNYVEAHMRFDLAAGRGGERFPRLSALPRDGRCSARTFHGGSADLEGGWA